MESTTIQLPISLRDRLQALKRHPRQAYHEVISDVLDSRAPSGSSAAPSTDPLLHQHRASILNLARKNGLRNVHVFGSRARGDARADSDLDLLYELEKGRNLFDVAGFSEDVKELTGLRVDLVSRRALTPRLAKEILKDARPL